MPGLLADGVADDAWPYRSPFRHHWAADVPGFGGGVPHHHPRQAGGGGVNRDWMHLANCRDYPNPDDFFPTTVGVGANKQVQRVIQVCAGCPVIAECLQYQEATGSTFGVWGGRMVRTRVWGSTNAMPIHGTEAMYRRHQRRGERPCEACRQAASRARDLRSRRGTA